MLSLRCGELNSGPLDAYVKVLAPGTLARDLICQRVLAEVVS